MIGIENYNNTCYINVCIQLLYHNKELIKHMLKSKNKNKIIIDLLKIFKLMNTEENTIDISDFLDEIEKYSNENNIEEYKDVSKQSDCNEFLIFLLNIIHKLYSNKVSINYIGEIKTDNDKLAIKSIESLSNNFKNEFSFIMPLFY